MKSNNYPIIKKLICLLKPYIKSIIAIFICLFLNTLINLVIPILNKNIMDNGLIAGNLKLLIALAVLVFILYTLSNTINMYKESKRVMIESKIRTNLFKESYYHLMKMRLSYFDNKNVGEIFNNINTDVSTITTIAKDELFFVLTQLFNIVGGLVGLFIINAKLACIVILFIPIKFFTIKIFAHKRKRQMNAFLRANERQGQFWGDSINCIKEIKLFNLYDAKIKRLIDIESDVSSKIKKVNILTQWNYSVDNIFIHLLNLVIYILGGVLIIKSNLTVGDVFAFISYSSYVTDPIAVVLNIGYHISGIIPSAKRYFEFADCSEEVLDNELQAKSGNLEFSKVTFSYVNGRPVLNDISFSITEKEKIALVGMNGAGKSTIIDLILRFIEPSHGDIFLSGISASIYSLNSYRALFSVVSQQIGLFNDTIRNNICLDRAMDKRELEHIIEICGLSDFIREVSLDYIVGSNGNMLSGGQKQKVALARALIQNRPIVILDEATSNSDVFAEKQLNELLTTYLKAKTVILVTHRLSVLKDVDRIVLLKDGEINACGTFTELIKGSAHFNEMTSAFID